MLSCSALTASSRSAILSSRSLREFLSSVSSYWLQELNAAAVISAAARSIISRFIFSVKFTGWLESDDQTCIFARLFIGVLHIAVIHVEGNAVVCVFFA